MAQLPTEKIGPYCLTLVEHSNGCITFDVLPTQTLNICLFSLRTSLQTSQSRSSRLVYLKNSSK